MTLSELPNWLNKVVASIERPSGDGALKEWLTEFIGDVGKGFQSSESQLGQAWAPLKRKRPAGHNQGERALIDTGDLMLSVLDEGGDTVKEISADSLIYGTRTAYAAYQQYGTSRIPARPFLQVNEDQASRAAELVARQLIKALAAA